MAGPDPSARQTSALALLLYAGVIVYQSLANGGAWHCTGPVLEMGARISRADVIANIVAYVPLGLLVVLATPRAWSDRGTRASVARVLIAAVASTAAIGLLSLSMELLQACQARRVSSIYDLIANVTGGVVGVGTGLAFRGAAVSMGTRAHAQVAQLDGRLRTVTVMVAVAWVVSQATPWVFSVDVGTVRSNLSFLRRWSDGPPFDAWAMARHAGAWVAIGCALRLAWRDARTALGALIVVAAASLGLQVLLDARTPLSFAELAGMTIAGGVIVPTTWFAGARLHPRRLAAGLLAAAIVTVAAYELRPDTAAATHAFSWWPRVGLGGLRGALDYALLFGWFGMSAVVAAHWAASDGIRNARRAWPVVAIVLTLAFELMQTRIPGRGPDVSAPLFTCLAVLVAKAALSDGRSRSSTITSG